MKVSEYLASESCPYMQAGLRSVLAGAIAADIGDDDGDHEISASTIGKLRNAVETAKSEGISLGLFEAEIRQVSIDAALAAVAAPLDTYVTDWLAKETDTHMRAILTHTLENVGDVRMHSSDYALVGLLVSVAQAMGKSPEEMTQDVDYDALRTLPLRPGSAAPVATPAAWPSDSAVLNNREFTLVLAGAAAVLRCLTELTSQPLSARLCEELRVGVQRASDAIRIETAPNARMLCPLSEALDTLETLA